ncbi:hypothetical protein [Aequorivita echinoideorum]|uniref:hypothetical protein n=1 Tax=Aequorivita echinoideorum TaxID=1549647 RepID=UPI001BDA8370|nr:hypothetical protein [Aequorivita echinoideorum]
MSFLIYSLLFLVQANKAAPPPPDEQYEVDAPQFPIDDSIWILMVLGLLLGIYFIYKHSQSTNSPA